jgi:hypothetical protein
MPFLLLGLVALGGLLWLETQKKPQPLSQPVVVSPGQATTINVPVGSQFALQPAAGNSFTDLSIAGPPNAVLVGSDSMGNFLGVGVYRAIAAGSAQISLSFATGAIAVVTVNAS